VKTILLRIRTYRIFWAEAEMADQIRLANFDKGGEQPIFFTG
jgi:hypothetical protein